MKEVAHQSPPWGAGTLGGRGEVTGGSALTEGL